MREHGKGGTEDRPKTRGLGRSSLARMVPHMKRKKVRRLRRLPFPSLDGTRWLVGFKLRRELWIRTIHHPISIETKPLCCTVLYMPFPSTVRSGRQVMYCTLRRTTSGKEQGQEQYQQPACLFRLARLSLRASSVRFVRDAGRDLTTAAPSRHRSIYS